MILQGSGGTGSRYQTCCGPPHESLARRGGGGNRVGHSAAFRAWSSRGPFVDRHATHSDARANPDRDADSDAPADAYTDPHAYTEADAYADPYAHTEADAYAYADPHSEADADSVSRSANPDPSRANAHPASSAHGIATSDCYSYGSIDELHDLPVRQPVEHRRLRVPC